MPNKLVIDGVIGCDVISSEVKSQISEFDDSGIDITLNSPGGSVFEGISIFNSIKKYREEHGNVKVNVDGLAASMGSIIMLAGNSIEFEKNASVMIHNPWIVALGDYRDMEKQASLLKQLRSVLATTYEDETNIGSKAEINAMMDNETWFFQNDLKKFGTIKTSDADAKTIDDIKAYANVEVYKAQDWLKQQPQNDLNLDRMSSLLSEFDCKGSSKMADAPKQTKATKIKNKTNGEKKMDLNELKSQHPALVAEIKKEAVAEERVRVSAHFEFVSTSQDAVIEAIKNGDEFTAAHSAKYTKDMALSAKLEDKVKDQPEDLKAKAIKAEEEVEDKDKVKKDEVKETEEDKKEQAALDAAFGNNAFFETSVEE